MHRHWLFLARLPHQHPDSAHRIRNVETAVAEHKCITIRIIAALYSFISPSVYSRCFTGNANSNAVVYRKCRNTTTIFSVCSFFSTIFLTVFYGFLRWIEKLSRIAYFSLHPTIILNGPFVFRLLCGRRTYEKCCGNFGSVVVLRTQEMNQWCHLLNELLLLLFSHFIFFTFLFAESNFYYHKCSEWK